MKHTTFKKKISDVLCDAGFHKWSHGLETDIFYHSYRFRECSKCHKKEGGVPPRYCAAGE